MIEHITIRITDQTDSLVRWTPRWDTLQTALGEMFGTENGLMTRIRRPDGKCGYRDKGEYEIRYDTNVRNKGAQILEIKLIIE